MRREIENIIVLIESRCQARPTPMEFEMAYQARAAIDRIRFAIKHTEQFAPHTDQMREAGLQLLDVLERLESVDRTTINRELSKVSQAFKVGKRPGKIDYTPPGGCDFMKDPERKNTRLVRLPDRYYSIFRNALHPALRCFFVVDYNVGRRKDQLLRTKWEQVNFDEKHIFLPLYEKLSAT